MRNVAYIKQKAIEIANNSSHEIIIGVMNQKYVEADCSAIFSDVDCYSDYEEANYNSVSYSARREARIERRNNRKAERMARRSTY